MRVKLEEVCKRIYAGGDVPKDRFSEKKTEVYSIPIFANAEKDEGLYGYTDEAREKELSITVAARGTIGYTAIRREPFLPVVRLITVVPDLSKVSERYLFYALKNCKPQSSGTSIPQLTVPDIKKYTLNLIDIVDQESIADRLDKLNEIINLRKEEIIKFDELIKARFVELFGNPVINDKGWNTDSCKNLMSKIGSGATPKGGRESYCDEGISLIRSMTVYNNRFEYKDLAHITDEQAKQLDNVTIEKSDVLLNITGASVARCCVVPDDLLPARVNQHVSIIRCKKSLLPEFVCSMFTEDNYQRLLWNIATAGGATREAITKQQIEELKLIVPPIDLQKQFMDFVKQIDKSKIVVQKALDEARLLFDSLMQEYFG